MMKKNILLVSILLFFNSIFAVDIVNKREFVSNSV